MIKNTTVYICDICGFMAAAKIDCTQREQEYMHPAGWMRGVESGNVHFCPSCAGKLLTLDCNKGLRGAPDADQ